MGDVGGEFLSRPGGCFLCPVRVIDPKKQRVELFVDVVVQRMIKIQRVEGAHQRIGASSCKEACCDQHDRCDGKHHGQKLQGGVEDRRLLLRDPDDVAAVEEHRAVVHLDTQGVRAADRGADAAL